MIFLDKAPNTLKGEMGWRTYITGEEYPVPTQGIIRLNEITEGIGRNGKPCVTLVFDKGVVIEVPDYGIEKYRYYEESDTTKTGQETGDKAHLSGGMETVQGVRPRKTKK